MTMKCSTQSPQGAIYSKTTRLVETIPFLPSFCSMTIDLLQTLFVENKVELTKHVSAAGGALPYLDGDATYYSRWHATQGGNKFPEAQHNLIEHQSLPDNLVWSVVTYVTQWFQSRLQPFSWVVGPMDQPHLELALQKHGLVLAETQLAMAYDLQQDDSPKCQKGSSVWLTEMDAGSRVITKYAYIPTTQGQPQAQHLDRKHRLQDRYEKLMFIEEQTKKWRQEAGIGQQEGAEYVVKPAAEPAALADYRLQLEWLEEHTRSGRQKVDANRATAERTYPEYTVHPVVSTDMVSAWVEAWAYMVSPTCEGVSHWVSIYQKLFSTLSPTQFEMIVAKASHPNPEDKDGIVGTAYMHYYKGIASVHCVTVNPAHRGRGVGPGLLHVAAKLAKSKGYSIMTATSTDQGQGMLFKAGFRQIGVVKQYCYNLKNMQMAMRMQNNKEQVTEDVAMVNTEPNNESHSPEEVETSTKRAATPTDAKIASEMTSLKIMATYEKATESDSSDSDRWTMVDDSNE
ncbi:hypothetical protein GGR57DRAFT_159164 [Xylariaceae sp. FL1272]|nr:hypothetical protein GGR57DRAFT_159164 [Xylariaceae sp. FL1272]